MLDLILARRPRTSRRQRAAVHRRPAYRPGLPLAAASGWSSRPTARTTTTRSPAPTTPSARRCSRPRGERVVRVTWEQAIGRPRQTLGRFGAAGAPRGAIDRDPDGTIDARRAQQVGGVVPEPDDAVLALEVELADRGGAEVEVHGLGDAGARSSACRARSACARGRTARRRRRPPGRGRSRGRRARRPAPGTRRRARRRATGPTPAGRRGCRRWCGPRRRRSRTRRGRARPARARRGRPAPRSRAPGAAGW